MIEAYELILDAPKGFRPSDWAERLMNWDEAAELGEDLVYTKYVRDNKVLAVRAELVDPSNRGYKDRIGVWNHILEFVKDNGFGVLIDPRLEGTDPRIHALVSKLLDERGIKHRVVSPDRPASVAPNVSPTGKSVVEIPEPRDVQRALEEALAKVTKLGDDIALIGGMALAAHGIERYTRDIDLATTVKMSSAIEEALPDLDPRPLKMGGVSILTSVGVRVDLIDLRFEYRLLLEEAIREAKARGQVVQKGGFEVPVVPLPYLAALKLIADRPQDEVDLHGLLAMERLDYKATRDVVLRHVGPYGARRLDKVARSSGRKDVPVP